MNKDNAPICEGINSETNFHFHFTFSPLEQLNQFLPTGSELNMSLEDGTFFAKH